MSRFDKTITFVLMSGALVMLASPQQVYAEALAMPSEQTQPDTEDSGKQTPRPVQPGSQIEQPANQSGVIDPERGLKKRKKAKPSTPVEQKPKAKKDALKVLPKVEMPARGLTQLSKLGKIKVNQISLTGNTVLPDTKLSSLISAYEGKELSIEELNQLRFNLSKLYLQAGYINSGVILPDQKVQNGIVYMKVIEGGLTRLDIVGLQRLRAHYVESRIRRLVGFPLNMNRLSEAVQLLSRDPLIRQINARLIPTDNLGEGVLVVDVKENDMAYYSVGLDNYLSPSIGSERLALNLGHANVFGLGDDFNLRLDLTRGLNSGGLAYRVPLSGRDNSISVYGDYRDYIVVEEPFDQIDIESTSTRFGMSYQHPLRKRLHENLSLNTGFEVKHVESSILDQDFSFSLGSIDGEMDVSVLSAGMNWVTRQPNQVVSMGLSLRIGLDVLDATSDSRRLEANQGQGLPDGEFVSLRGQVQFARLLPVWESKFVLRSAFQHANDTLLGLEKFALGGVYSVRGYRENQFVRDNGMTLTGEWSIPVYRDKTNRQELAFVSFLDHGTSWDYDADKSKTDKASISSVGVGVVWDAMQAWHGELYYGYALDDDEILPPAEKVIQDEGIHLQVTYKGRF